MPPAWADAICAAALFATDPASLGGIVVRAPAGPVRDAWERRLRTALGAVAVRRMPAQIADDRLLGGVDLPASLRAGRPVAASGLLADVNGGVLIATTAERLPAATAGRLAAALDQGAVVVERDGMRARHAARFGLILFDEGEDEETAPAALLDRLAFRVDLRALGLRDLPVDAAERPPASAVVTDAAVAEALCTVSEALGVSSLRACLLALRTARAAAGLGGRRTIEEADVALAARLVLAWRATRLPPSGADTAPDDAPPPAEQDTDATPRADEALEDRVLQATAAAVPSHILAQLVADGPTRTRVRDPGRSGVQQRGLRGRPAGVRADDPRGGKRLDLIATLRAAAPWQALRRQEYGQPATAGSGRVLLRRDDLRVVHRRQRSASLAIFVVDASGSAALHRLAEAKGAVELLLADCYVRRDQVALVAFRGRQAEVLLPPTRSLARAKRLLAGLPGGGGTPLAAGIDAAAALAGAAKRRGQAPLVVLLTDGRPNIGRDGSAGRARAEADALAAGRILAEVGVPGLLVDVAPQPHPFARSVAQAMGARYLPLPLAQAARITRAVSAALAAA